MSDPASPTFKVLFVTDDSSFLDLVRQSFSDLSGGAWEILTAGDAPTTTLTLQQQKIELLVLDVSRPGISGRQLIGLLQKDYPDIPKVLLAGVVEESDRVAALENGASLFLEKPGDPAGLQSLYATLNELLKWREKQGSSAAPRATVLDLVKLECAAKNSRVFEVFNTEIRGTIYIKDGDIIHAECPGRRGQSAFSYLTTRLDAEFSLKQFTENPERSIVRQWEFLYLEAMQLRAQLAEAAEDSQPAPQQTGAEKAATEKAQKAKSKPTKTAPPPPSTEPATGEDKDTAPPPPSVTDEEATRALFRRPAPLSDTSGPATEAAPPEKPGGTAEAPEALQQLRMLRPDVPTTSPATPKAKTSAALPAAKAGVTADKAPAGPRIQELLVCSYSAEILHDWQCPQAETRLKFVEVARDRSERLSTHLPLGPVDRLELQATKGRLVLRFQEDGAVLLRSATALAFTAAGPGQLHPSMADWLTRAANIRGLLAAGILRPPQGAVTQSVDREYGSDALDVAWQCVQELLDAAPQQGLEPWQLRWVFEKSQLYVARRKDGKALATFLAKDPTAVDTGAVETVFRDFKALEVT